MRIRNAFEEIFCLPSILTNNDIIFTLRPGLKTGVEKGIFWYEIGSEFWEPGGKTPPPRIPRSTPSTSGTHPCVTHRHFRLFWKDICVDVSKSIGLAHSWKEIYVSNLQQVFSETRLVDVDLSKTSAMHFESTLSIWTEEIQAKTAVDYANSTLNILWHSLTAIIGHT